MKLLNDGVSSLRGLTVLALLGMVALLLRHQSDQRRLTTAATDAAVRREELVIGRLEHAALLRVLNQLDWNSRLVAGTEVLSGKSFARELSQDGVYNIVRSTCGACVKNYPAIVRLAKDAPGRVAVLARDDGIDLHGYAERNLPSVPLVQDGVGRLLENVPDYATPITVLIKGSRVVEIVTGGIDPGMEKLFAANLHHDQVQAVAGNGASSEARPKTIIRLQHTQGDSP